MNTKIIITLGTLETFFTSSNKDKKYHRCKSSEFKPHILNATHRISDYK